MDKLISYNKFTCVMKYGNEESKLLFTDMFECTMIKIRCTAIYISL